MNLCWEEILEEANRWIDESIKCYSLVAENEYFITKINEKKNPTIHLERKNGKPYDLGSMLVKNLLTRIQNSNNKLSIEDDKKSIDRLQMNIVVRLHPYLDFSDDNKFIVVLDKPKRKIKGLPSYNPSSESSLQYIAREIRRGQTKFRKKLFDAYNGKCSISSTNVENVLDAAHIIPYSANKANDPSNGLLLRSDIHNLYDDYLISINPKTQLVEINNILKGTVYECYGGNKINDRYDGNTLSDESLNHHYKHFQIRLKK